MGKSIQQTKEIVVKMNMVAETMGQLAAKLRARG